jgi:hypothetical protein
VLLSISHFLTLNLATNNRGATTTPASISRRRCNAVHQIEPLSPLIVASSCKLASRKFTGRIVTPDRYDCRVKPD